MKLHIKTALLGIALSSFLVADLSAQYFQPGHTIYNDGVQGMGVGNVPGIQAGQPHSPITDMRYRGPINPITYKDGPAIPGRDFIQGRIPTQFPASPALGQSIQPVTGGPAIPGRDFQQGRIPTPFPTNPVPGQNIQPVTGGPAIPGQDFLRGNVPTPFPTSPVPGQPGRPFPGQIPGLPGQPLNRIRGSFQSPQPQNMNLLHHNNNQTLIGDTYNDGRSGSMHGSIGTIEEANLDLVSEPGFAGVRGSSRGGIGAQGHVEQIHSINGVPLRQSASGNVFLGAEANAQAGLSPQGLGAGAGGFAGARAQLRRGIEVGGVNVGQTIEGQVGVGAEANAHLGLQNGRFRINGELGAAVGVGAKMGVDAEVDLGETGRFVEKHGSGVIRDVGNSAKDVNRWGNQAGRDISRTTNKVGNDVKRTANKVGGGIKKIGNSIFGK